MLSLSRLAAACTVALVATTVVHAQQRSVRPATRFEYGDGRR